MKISLKCGRHPPDAGELALLDMCSANEITKTDIYIQKKHKEIIFLLWKGLVIFLVFNEEIAFNHNRISYL